MKKLVIVALLCFLSHPINSLVVQDEFIVDEEQALHKTHAEQGISKIKKSITTKPVVRSMAMSSAPKKNLIEKTPAKSEAQSTKKHIEPKISLEQSLKNLDLAASKRTSGTEKKDKAKVKSIEESKDIKKSAAPNILTNSTITGFLSNNPKYTIDSVGISQDVKKKTNSDEKVAPIINKNTKNITSRDTVAKVNGANQVIKIDHEPSLLPKTKNQFISNNKSFVEHGTPSTNLHVATEDDFVKLRYVKKKEIEENAVKKEIVSTYHEAECNEDKKCPKNKYCRHFHCFEAHRKHHECDEDDECADDMPCIYGRCDDKAKGSPGAICEKDGDCGDGCCVLEPTIDEHHGICKVKLEEFHQCSPVLFRKVWIGEKPECGPCADGLECVERGIHSSHLICMKKK